MSRLDEQLSERFHAWEHRGRGWHVFDEPVQPEPPFRPFHGNYLPAAPPLDDGRRPTALSSFVQKLSQKLSPKPPPIPVEPEPEAEPQPQPLIRDPLVELQTSLPASLNIPKEAFEQFLSNLSLCREPIAFELLGLSQKVIAQFALHPDDASLARRQLQAYFPEATFQPSPNPLAAAWDACSGDHILAVEFGLEREFMFPLAGGKLDLFIGLIGALSELQPCELGLFQVLFQPVQHDWAESIMRAVTHADGKPFFVNEPELAAAANHKIARPLYAAVVRILVRTEDYERTLQIARDIAGALRVFIHPQGNALIPLNNEDYPFAEHVADVLARQSRRSGMLLNVDELIGFVHLPSSAVRSVILQREAGKTKAAPAMVCQPKGLRLGENLHAGKSVSVRLSPEHRVRHTHIIGTSGKGKSTLLLNLIRQDIANGEGVAVLDPHGDLVDKILAAIPPERIGDVILVDPSDEAYSVGFNILSAHSDLEKTLLASDLVSVFRRLSTSWGDQMGSVLNNAILVFLERQQGGTLSDLRRFLLEPAYRAEVLKTVQDPELVYYWQKGFPQLSGNKSVGPIVTRLEAFLAPRPIRYMVSQPENRLDFAHIMDRGQIFLAKLSQGMLGRENSLLLGTLLVAKFQQIAMSRQAQQVAGRKDFWLYIDEFHNFITPSMAEILTGARKYRIGLTLAHQEVRQLERDSEVASAVLSNPGTRICFGLGDEDARKLAQGFSFFDARDLQNLEIGQAICRIEKASQDFNLTVPDSVALDPHEATRIRELVIAASRKTYARPRAEIEAALRAKLGGEPAAPKVAETKPVPAPLPQRAAQKVAEVSPPATPPVTEAAPPAGSKGTAAKPVPTPPPPPAAPATAAVPPPAKSPVAEAPPPAESKVTAAKPVSAPQPPRATPEVAAVPPPPKPPVAPAAAPVVAEAQVKPAVAPTAPDAEGLSHTTIKHHLGTEAESLDYTVTYEELFPDVQGRADIVLRRGRLTIICQVTVATQVSYEVDSLRKFLQTPVARIAVVAVSRKKLGQIREAFGDASPPAARVGFYSPEEFISKLYAWAAEDPEGGSLERGKLRKRPITLAEQKHNEKTMLAEIKKRMGR